jgi:cyanate lyase
MTKQLYLEIGKGQQTKILKKIKEKSDLTWEEIAKILKVNKRMIFFYLNEQSHLSVKKLEILIKKTKTNYKTTRKLKIIKLQSYEKIQIQKPPLIMKYQIFSELFRAMEILTQKTTEFA